MYIVEVENTDDFNVHDSQSREKERGKGQKAFPWGLGRGETEPRCQKRRLSPCQFHSNEVDQESLDYGCIKYNFKLSSGMEIPCVILVVWPESIKGSYFVRFGT